MLLLSYYEKSLQQLISPFLCWKFGYDLLYWILLLFIIITSFHFFPSELNKILWVALTVRKHNKNSRVCCVVHYGIKQNLWSQRISCGRYNQLGVTMTISPDQDSGKVQIPSSTSILRSVLHWKGGISGEVNSLAQGSACDKECSVIISTLLPTMDLFCLFTASLLFNTKESSEAIATAKHAGLGAGRRAKRA